MIWYLECGRENVFTFSITLIATTTYSVVSKKKHAHYKVRYTFSNHFYTLAESFLNFFIIQRGNNRRLKEGSCTHAVNIVYTLTDQHA